MKTRKEIFMNRPLISSILLFCVFSVTLGNPEIQPKKYIVPSVKIDTVEEKVIVLSNLRYGVIPDSIDDSSSDRIMDLYLPIQSKSKKIPVFVFIHGGGFRNGDKSVSAIQQLSTKVAESGIAVISMNYRLALRHNLDEKTMKGTVNGKFNPMLRYALTEASEDASCLLSWICKNGREYNLQTYSVAIGGSSAGAMTALQLAYVTPPKFIQINSVVDLWGALEHPEKIKLHAPPVLIYHGDKDQVVAVDYAYKLFQQMTEKHNKASILNIMPGAGHAQYDVILNTKMEELVIFLKKNL